MAERRGLVRVIPVALAAVLVAVAPLRLVAQVAGRDTILFFRGLELETSGKPKEAMPLYRASLVGANGINAFLGLERVLHELGWLDSLIEPTDAMIRLHPKEPVYRIAQLRTYQILGRRESLRRAFDDWVEAAASSPDPYREYARLLIDRNDRATADSVLRLARSMLGSIKGLEVEDAQLRAANGEWIDAAKAWRIALVGSPHFEASAAYSLNGTPMDKRGEVRAVFLAPPVDVGARKALAALESIWGSLAEAWVALRDLPPTPATVDAWSEFAEEAAGEHRWSLARDALMSAHRASPSPDLALRAATAALEAGDPSAALLLVPLAQLGRDSARIAKLYVPLHTRALSLLGRPDDAAELVARFERWLAPGPRSTITRTIALGWVRRGDLPRARAALAAAGPEADSSDTAGWLALYEGDLKTARALLRAGGESSPELAIALGTIARISGDRAPDLGAAFLALARGDSAAASAGFLATAEQHPEAASRLLLLAAQIQASRGDDIQATIIWKRIVESMPAAAEAAEADFEWGRALGRRGDVPGAIARMEHLILSYPESALLPQARRELERLRGRAA